MKNFRDVFVVGGVRTPFVKSGTAYVDVKRQDLLMAPLKAMVEKYSLAKHPVGDVALGALLNSSATWGIARESVLLAGMHPYTPAYFVQRACGTSLEATAQIALKIAAGQIEDGIAGGVDTNSDVPVEVSENFRHMLLEANAQKTTAAKLATFLKFRPSFLKPKFPVVVEPQTGLSMGEHCELMVKEWKITRAEQDKIALASHKNAVAAYEKGFYKDLVIPFGGLVKDGFPRGDTSLEKLAKLKPAFDRSGNGSITAGNASPLTDGAAAVLLASGAQVMARGWKAQAKFIDAESAALDFVHGDGLLMAPTVAVARLLKRNGLKLQDFDFYEIHEAFAGQVACTLKAWESEEYCQKYASMPALGSIDRNKLNVVGSSIAVGHPFAATGARVVATLAKLLEGTKGKRGLISVCTAGGMGVAAILESAE